MKTNHKKILDRITNNLILKASFLSNLGLLNGKMGICIFLYILARKMNNKDIEAYAGELLDQIFEEVNVNTPVDFENGLSGIGWGIDYLVQEKYVEAENDVLESLDNLILNGLLAHPFTIMNENALYGIGLYYIKRLNAQENETENLSILRIKTNIIYLLEDCKRLLSKKKIFDINVPQLTVRQLCSLTFFFYEICKMSLFSKLINKQLSSLVSYATESLPVTNKYIDSIVLIELLKKIDSIKHIGLLKHNSSKLGFNSLLESKEILNECILWTCSSLIYSLDNRILKDHPLIYKQAITFLEKEETWQRFLTQDYQNQLSLEKGLAGLGLFILNTNFN